MRRLSVFATITLLLPAVLLGQEFRATLTGRVLDSTQAAVPGATVQATNTGTNEVTTATTDATGNYTIPFLRPGTYTVTAEAAGFKKFVQEGLVLQVAQAATLNISLEVGAVTEQVTITAEAPLLETARADRGGVIDRQRVHELPLNGRNPFLLGAMVAGVNFWGAAIWQRPFDNGAIAEWTINGSQTRGTEFLLDGAPNNGQAGGNNIAYVPPVDSVQEFKIHTNTYDAQYGHTNGGIINVSLKSGTNAFHGTAYEFMRRKGWDANTFQNNAYGKPKPDHLLDQYGVQLEGPVYIPKLFDGRDRLFFLFNYEGYREVWPQQATLSVPAPEFMQGDFSNLKSASGQQIVIYNPFTGREQGGAWVRDPFPGNKIPQNMLNPIAQKILSYMPKPNTTSPGVDYSRNNHFMNYSATDDFYQLVFKFDANIGNRHRAFFRHGSNDRTEMRTENGILGSPGECCQLPFQRINDHVTADWVTTVSPTFIFNVRLSYNRFIEKGRSFANEGFDMTSHGFPASLINQLPYGAHFGRFHFNDYISIGRYPGGNWTNTYAVHPNATWIRGSHSMKFGLDYRFTQYAERNTGDIFWLRGTRRFTQRVYNQGDPLSGNSIAEFLLGIPAEGGLNYNAFPIHGFPYYSPYFQDDWKVSRRLTLNLGLRWDLNIPPDERHNRMNGPFNSTSKNPIADMIDKTKFPEFANLKGGLTFAGVGGNSRRAAKTDRVNIQPRIGGAFQLTSKVVARGGWGIYFLNPTNDYLQRNGFSISTPLVSTLDDYRTPISPNFVNNPFPGGITQPPGAKGGLTTYAGRNNFNWFNPDFELPYVHQFSAGFQIELPKSSTVEVSYVGSRTKKLQTQWENWNEPPLEFRKQCNWLEGGRPSYCNELLPNPFKGLEPFRGTTYFTADKIRRYDLMRPYPQFGEITQRGRNDGGIWYNSLQIQFQTRFRGTLNILATYTLSKQVEQWGWTDPFSFAPQRGPYFVDRPHRFTLTNVWELPFGRGRKFANTSHPFWSRLVSGWEVNSFFQWESGRPADVPENVLIMKDPKLEVKNWTAHQVYRWRPCVGRMDVNTGAITMQPYSLAWGCKEGDYDFIALPSRSQGFVPRLTPYRWGHIRLHTAPNIDFSINKMTQITEKTRVQFRAEAFNLTNTFYYGRDNFNTNPNDSRFGSIFPRDTWNGNRYPRQIQLAVKFLW